MKNKGYWTLLGFLCIVFGFTAIVLQLVGVSWYFLRFLEWGGRLFAFLAKLVLVIAGVMIVVLGGTDWDRERRESGDDEAAKNQ